MLVKHFDTSARAVYSIFIRKSSMQYKKLHITNKILNKLLVLVFGLFLFSVAAANPVHAVQVECADGVRLEASIVAIENGNVCAQHGGYKSNSGSGGEDGSGSGEDADADSAEPNPGTSTSGDDQLDNWLQRAVDLLSLLVGLIIVISIIIAGVQYMTAGGNASQVAAAKNRIGMAVLAFILFAFTYALLQWLIPGGVFS